MTYEYTVQNGIITDPGKFEGEPYYIPKYWHMAQEGCASDEYYTESDILVSKFDLDRDDYSQFPELKGVKSLHLWESESGFVYCEQGD